MSARFSRLLALALSALLCVADLSAASREPQIRKNNRRAEKAFAQPPNLGSSLRFLLATYNDLASEVPNEKHRASIALRSISHVQRDARRRVLVDVDLDGTKSLRAVSRRIRKLRGTVVAQVDWYRKGLVTAWIPLKKVRKLAASFGVSSVNLALRPQVRVGKTTSQGVTVHHTDTVNTSGYKGSGITVGVLSDSYDADTSERSYPGFTRASADVTSGDLPGTTNPNGYTTSVNVFKEYTQSDGTDEGRAMLQIVHDLAPAAKLAFATSGTSTTEMATNIGFLQSSVGCKIICDDIVFYEEPFFSDGVIAQAVDRVTAQGVTYFSAAGNDGNSGWAGDFNPVDNTTGLARAAAGGVTTSGITQSERNAITQWHSFGKDSSGNDIVVQNVTTGSSDATLVFQWDDPFGVSGGITADFDILVFNSSGTYQATLSSVTLNKSTNKPIEIPSSDLSASTSYKICIVLTNRVDSALRKASHLRYVAMTGDAVTGDYITPTTPTSFGHCCAATAIGVGAYNYDLIGSTQSHTYKTALEDYSSNGPVQIYFDSAGNRLATGILRKQPVISAVDNVNTTFFPPSSSGVSANDYEGDGYPNFAGTSAAAPHAAAVAALLANAAAVKGITLTPADIRTILINSAQKTADQDLNIATAVAGPITIVASGDSNSANNNDFFQISFSGAANQLSRLVIDLSPVGMHFDSNTSTGHAFTIGTVSGTPTPVFNGTPTLSAGAKSTNTSGKATINFTNFRSTGTLTFGVDRDEDLTSSGGNGADELGGSTSAGGATVSVLVDGATYTGVFVNKLGGAFHYKAGYGLLDANAALNYLLLAR